MNQLSLKPSTSTRPARSGRGAIPLKRKSWKACPFLSRGRNSAQPASLETADNGTRLTRVGGAELPAVSYRVAGAWMLLPFSLSILYSTPSMMTLDCTLVSGTCFPISSSSASSSNSRARFCCSFRAAKTRQTQSTQRSLNPHKDATSGQARTLIIPASLCWFEPAPCSWKHAVVSPPLH